MKCPSYNNFFDTISSGMRMKIIQLLVKSPMTVTEICKSLNEEQSKISHNLKKLHDCHVVESKREGKSRVYSLNKDTVLPLMKLVEKHVQQYCDRSCKNV